MLACFVFHALLCFYVIYEFVENVLLQLKLVGQSAPLCNPAVIDICGKTRIASYYTKNLLSETVESRNFNLF